MSTKHRRLPTASLSLHPQAGVVPEMPPDQFELFLADVKERGILDPVGIIRGTRTILEGRSRWTAAVKAGLPDVPVVEIDLGDESPVLYMLRSALLRRHLTKGQAAALAVEIETELRKAAKERQRAGAQKARAAAASAKVPERIPEATPPAKKKDRSGEARELAAAAAGVNPRYVSDAKAVKAKAPELYEKVKNGTITLPEAKAAVKPSANGHAKPSSPKPDGPAIVVGGPQKLKPCPFCGSTDLKVLFGSWVVIQCQGCHTVGPRKELITEDQVRTAWNRRT